MKKTKFKKFNRNCYGFDIETHNNNKEPYIITIYSEKYKKSLFSIEDFFEEIKHCRYRNSFLIASNLRFDLLSLIFNEKYFKFFNIQWRGKSSGIKYARTFYSSEFGFSQYKNKNSKSITFIDTYNFQKMSVKNMGDILNIPKLKPPFCVKIGGYPNSMREWKKVKEYCMRDSEISYKYFLFLISIFEKIKASFKLTIASISMSCFTNNFLKKTIYQTTKDNLDWLFGGFYGGRTETYERGNIKQCLINSNIDKLYIYDVNSIYPAVMHDEEFPDPNTIKVSYSNSLKFIKKYEGMSEVSIFCPRDVFPLLPKREKTKLIFPTGSFSGRYCHNELRLAIELGYTIKKVYKTIYYTKKIRPFKKFVEKLYNLRIKYKKENNKIQIGIKLILNSLYGKFGQRYTGRTEFKPLPTKLKDIEKYDDFDIVEYNNIKMLKVNNIETEPAPFCIPIWAAYITAYARMKMYFYLKKSNPIYTDTDSFITRIKFNSNKEKLGSIKLECEIKNGYIIRPKFYCFTGKLVNKKIEKIKLKGFGSRLDTTTFENILKNKKSSYLKFCSLKEAIRLKIFPNEIITQNKTFSLEDTKRDWVGKINVNGWEKSRPINVCEDTDNIYIKRIKRIIHTNKLYT